MNHKLITILIILLVTPFITADRVGVVIDFPDGSNHVECLEANEGTNGFDLLEELSLSTDWTGPSSFGHQLCTVNGIGDCSFTESKFWRFLISSNNKWEFSPVGVDGGDNCWDRDAPLLDFLDPNFEVIHYCVEDKDLISMSYGKGDDPLPVLHTFDQICSPLELIDVKVYVDGKKQSDADEDGGDIEAIPGSEIRFKIKVENVFTFDDGLEIDDIEAEVIIEDIDDGRDLDENTNFNNLDVDEDDEDEIEITIPLILDDDEYDVELIITGRDSNGVNQEIIINYDLEIDKESHDLIFSKTELQTLESCPGDPNELHLEIANIGDKDESGISLSVINNDLKINYNINFNLKEGGDNSVYVDDIHFIVPSLTPGDYKINLNLDYSEILKEDITLTVLDCKNTLIGNVIKEDIPEKIIINQATPRAETYFNESFFQVQAIPIILGIFLIFLIVAIILIISIINK